MGIAMKTYGNVHSKVKHLSPNTSRLTPVRGLICLTHTTQTTHTQENTMSVIEMQTMTVIVHNLPRIANALERIAKVLEKNQPENDKTNTADTNADTNAEQGDANE